MINSFSSRTKATHPHLRVRSCVRAGVCVCPCVCVRVCVRACVHACVHAHVYVVSVRASMRELRARVLASVVDRASSTLHETVGHQDQPSSWSAGRSSVRGMAWAILALAANALVLSYVAAQALLALAPLEVMLTNLRSLTFLAHALDALVGADARP